MIKLTFICAVLAIVRGCDISKCLEVPTLFYEEIGCTEVKDSEGCCTVRYNCPERPIDGKCHFKGKTYNGGEKLPDDAQPLCLDLCQCDETGGTLQCADVECEEYFRPYPSCTLISQHGKCCGTIVCDDKERAELSKTKCYVDGKEYIKGELIRPESRDYYHCICDEGFDNSTIFDNRYCKKKVCNIEVYRANDVDNGCIPIFYKKSTSCPFEWRCPETTDEVVKKNVLQVNDPELTCNFGKLNLRRGDELNITKEGVICRCDVPPIPHCVASHY